MRNWVQQYLPSWRSLTYIASTCSHQHPVPLHELWKADTLLLCNQLCINPTAGMQRIPGHPSFSNPPHFLGGTTNHLLCWRTASILSNVIYLALLFPMQVGAKCSEAVNRPKGKLQPHELPNPAKVYFQSTLGQAKAHAQLKLHHQQCKEPQYRDKCSQFHHVTAGCWRQQDHSDRYSKLVHFFTCIQIRTGHAGDCTIPAVQEPIVCMYIIYRSILNFGFAFSNTHSLHCKMKNLKQNLVLFNSRSTQIICKILFLAAQVFNSPTLTPLSFALT